jgi:hypothetical protein
MVWAAAAYAVIGVGSAALDRSGAPHHVHPWRLAAWLASAAVAVAHIGYEQRQPGGCPLATALHAASAVALGAFGLALAANVHWLRSAPRAQHPPLLALPIWPLITGVPAFIVAFAIAAVHTRLPRRPG